jgi:hypothetical protein
MKLKFNYEIRSCEVCNASNELYDLDDSYLCRKCVLTRISTKRYCPECDRHITLYQYLQDDMCKKCIKYKIYKNFYNNK